MGATGALVYGEVRTITAAQVDGPAECKQCGCQEPREKLWGMSAKKVTTSREEEVAYWLCAGCFEGGRRLGRELGGAKRKY